MDLHLDLEDVDSSHSDGEEWDDSSDYDEELQNLGNLNTNTNHPKQQGTTVTQNGGGEHEEGGLLPYGQFIYHD